jgi:pimeloyl-ACP methyl ester carboxylesterase
MRRASGKEAGHVLGKAHHPRAAGTAPGGEPGSWVSDAAREEFMAAYERALALWPQPREEFDIETATATTRVHACRPHPGGAPVVLLTGAGGNATGWYPHVAALAEAGPVYGIDLPGDPNPSVPRALMTPPENSAAWLDELLGRLSDRPAHLVGFSYGGWVAMNQAIRAPSRVASVTLLDPAGLTKLDARFWLWLSIGLATLTPMPDHRADPPDHRRPQFPDHPGAGPRPGEPPAERGGRHRPRQPWRLRPDQRAQRPHDHFHRGPLPGERLRARDDAVGHLVPARAGWGYTLYPGQ